jgi:hypothetical protein
MRLKFGYLAWAPKGTDVMLVIDMYFNCRKDVRVDSNFGRDTNIRLRYVSLYPILSGVGPG